MRVAESRACCMGSKAQPHVPLPLGNIHKAGRLVLLLDHSIRLSSATAVVLAGRDWDVPVEVFNSIETLLPTGKGRFLELWAPAQAGRAGWTHVAEAAASEDH